MGSLAKGGPKLLLPGFERMSLYHGRRAIDYFAEAVTDSSCGVPDSTNVLSELPRNQFNFMLDGRAGVRFPLHGGKSLSVAYMFQHMSNAYTAMENPGVDSHMVHLAYTFPFRFRRNR